MRTGRRGAFTLIELLVVVSIIALLIALLLPSLARARYRARVVQCLSNMHQWGVGFAAYAGDQHGYLPRFDLPLTTGRNTHDIDDRFLPAVARYGVGWRTWFCPTRAIQWQAVRDAAPVGVPLTDVTVAQKMHHTSFPFTLFSQSLWIPRRAGSLFPAGYPERLDASVKNKLPTLSDWLLSPDSSQSDPRRLLVGGHRFGDDGRLPVESTSVLFPDGHVQLNALDQIRARYQGNRWNFW